MAVRSITPPRPERQFVYRFYDGADRLLYVGRTANFGRRLSQHAERQPWAADVARIAVTPFDTFAEAHRVELAAIKAERPLYNRTPEAGGRRAWEARLAGRARRHAIYGNCGDVLCRTCIPPLLSQVLRPA